MEYESRVNENKPEQQEEEDDDTSSRSGNDAHVDDAEIKPIYDEEPMAELGVESYQKKLNLTRPDTYRSDLKRKTPYTAYSNPKGFIYHNKDKKNRLMRIDELHKFSDGTLNDVRSALDDILKRIRMEYLPQTVWRNVKRERAGAIIQAIDRQLRNIRFYTSAGNPIKEILLKLNLPDHRSILTDSKMEVKVPDSS
ncbi:hypothetical protein Tco_0971810 [Tanacetum coccineum]